MNSVQRLFWKLNFGLSNKRVLLLFSFGLVLAFDFITFQLETKISARKLRASQPKDTRNKSHVRFPKTVFTQNRFFSFGSHFVSHILVYGHEKKVNRFVDYLQRREERNMKKGEPFFLLSFLQHPLAMSNNGLFKLTVHFLIAKSQFDNGPCVTICSVAFFYLYYFNSKFSIFLEIGMKTNGNMKEKLIIHQKKTVILNANWILQEKW